jgi:glycerophosphoryl diester phosphodiesterase
MAPRPVFDRPIAHRGLHNRAAGVIENSASAFAAAIAGGYHIECDLQLTSDGVPVVFHDDLLKRLTGREGRVNGLTAAEVTALPLLDSSAGDRPQRVEELLQQVAGRTLLQVELKHQNTRAGTLALARAAATAVADYTGPLVFESFDPNLIALVRRYGFRGARGIITYRYDQADEDVEISPAERYVLKHLLHYPWTRFDFISCHDAALDLAAVKFFRSIGRPVTSWTIRSQLAADAVEGKADQIVFEGFEPRRA